MLVGGDEQPAGASSIPVVAVVPPSRGYRTFLLAGSAVTGGAIGLVFGGRGAPQALMLGTAILAGLVSLWSP